MKTIYTINKVVLIINLVLGLTIYLGLLFLIVTGTVQVLSFFYYLSQWKKTDPKLRKYFLYYGISVIVSLLPYVFIDLIRSHEILYWFPIICGSWLSICFLILSKRQKDYLLMITQPPKKLLI